MSKKLLFILPAIALLSACSQGVKESLGLAKEAPDEFQVTSRPPLTVPPDFALRPPKPGAPDKAETDAAAEAKAAVIGNGAAAPASAGEAAILSKAGATGSDGAIRDKLGAEQATRKVEPTAVGKLLGQKAKGPNEPIVDAKAEAERLKKAAEQGQPVDGADAKTVTPAEKSTLDKILR